MNEIFFVFSSELMFNARQDYLLIFMDLQADNFPRSRFPFTFFIDTFHEFHIDIVDPEADHMGGELSLSPAG